ncbi:hypothetical protein M4578_25330, partial [Salipiger sp. P9]|uniref:hypothetical protein n=1 Tax=Salipiger pentaromativorans TaxID=2943193 RepID=UPI002157D768
RAQNRSLYAKSKPDCMEIGTAKTVDQTFLRVLSSNERILINVNDSVTYSELNQDSNFIF